MAARGRGLAPFYGLVSLLISLMYVHVRNAWRRAEAAHHGAEEAIRIDQILDVSSAELGRTLQLRRAPVDLVELVRRVVGEWTGGSSRHELHLDVTCEHLVGLYDPARLARVVDNLVSNAVKYSPRGGAVVVALRCAPDQDRLWAVLSVCDEGVGIPATDLPSAFERFHRGSNVGSTSGTGVGLASAREIVQQHGGRIEITSSEGAGTTVVVWLPLELGVPETSTVPWEREQQMATSGLSGAVVGRGD